MCVVYLLEFLRPVMILVNLIYDQKFPGIQRKPICNLNERMC